MASARMKSSFRSSYAMTSANDHRRNIEVGLVFTFLCFPGLVPLFHCDRARADGFIVSQFIRNEKTSQPWSLAEHRGRSRIFKSRKRGLWNLFWTARFHSDCFRRLVWSLASRIQQDKPAWPFDTCMTEAASDSHPTARTRATRGIQPTPYQLNHATWSLILKYNVLYRSIWVTEPEKGANAMERKWVV